MYGLQVFTNARTGETFRALIRNKEPQAQIENMHVKESEARTAEGDVIISEIGSEYFALQHDYGGLSARLAVRSYSLAVAPISDRISVYRRNRHTSDNFGRPAADHLQTIAENVKAVVESKARVKQEKTPAQLVQITTRRVLCSLCAVEKGDLVSLNGSDDLHQIVEVDQETWDGTLLVLTLVRA